MNTGVYTSIKQIIFAILFLTIPFLMNGQVIKESYYKDKFKKKEVDSKDKGKYAEIIKTYGDSMVVTELVFLKTNLLLESVCYKNKIPHGIWKTYDKKLKDYWTTNYDFDVKYSKKIVENKIYYDFFKQEIESGINSNSQFEAPTLKSGRHLLSQINRSTRYPAFSRENGIQGTVKVLVKIDENGSLEVLHILKGVEPHLDAETIRVIRKCQDWIPAELDGKKVEVYSIVNMKFKLA